MLIKKTLKNINSVIHKSCRDTSNPDVSVCVCVCVLTLRVYMVYTRLLITLYDIVSLAEKIMANINYFHNICHVDNLWPVCFMSIFVCVCDINMLLSVFIRRSMIFSWSRVFFFFYYNYSFSENVTCD